MSTHARVFLEYLADGASGFNCFAEYYPHDQKAALQLYSLTGLEGADPPYQVSDMSLVAKGRLERDQDVITSEPIKVEVADLEASIGRLKDPDKIEPTLAVALQALRGLGPGARIVFWMMI